MSRLRRRLKRFIRSKKQKIEIEYNPKRLSAAAEWYKLRNPLGMMYRGFVFLIIRYLPPCGLKNCLYRMHGINIGRGVAISEEIYLDPLFPELITIEDGAILGTGVKMPVHGITRNKVWLARTIIKRNAVIGGYAFIKQGVTIGENAIVAAHSTVTKDVPPNVVVGNPPAQIIQRLK